MKKLQNWSIKFDDFMTKHKDTPFVWGKWDCCLFSDACIKAMTGESLIPKTLRWSDEKSALKAIRDYGKTLSGAIEKAAKKKKLIPTDPMFIQKGDLLVYKQESELCGMYSGSKVLGPSENGLITNQYEEIVAVWRIPNG